MLDEIKKTATGAAILKDWLGEGLEPVPASQATVRASICAACEKNMPGEWWSHAIGLVAEAIRRQVGVKNNISATTEFDDKLGTCAVCICNLPLKVWCPIDHIKNHTNQDTIDRLPGWCWQKKELAK